VDDRALLLLGLLRMQSQHGYQLNEFIEHNLVNITDMKKPTAYAILDRLASQKYIDVHIEQEGNRPPRKVYSITESGEKLFFQLLRKNLSESDAVTSAGDIGFMFIHSLKPEEVRTLLEQKLQSLEKIITIFEQVPTNAHEAGVTLAIQRKLFLMRADHQWLQEVLASSAI
jgi:DNA-binding PadR family transcriptional regulator